MTDTTMPTTDTTPTTETMPTTVVETVVETTKTTTTTDGPVGYAQDTNLEDELRKLDEEKEDELRKEKEDEEFEKRRKLAIALLEKRREAAKKLQEGDVDVGDAIWGDVVDVDVDHEAEKKKDILDEDELEKRIRRQEIAENHRYRDVREDIPRNAELQDKTDFELRYMNEEADNSTSACEFMLKKLNDIAETLSEMYGATVHAVKDSQVTHLIDYLNRRRLRFLTHLQNAVQRYQRARRTHEDFLNGVRVLNLIHNPLDLESTEGIDHLLPLSVIFDKRCGVVGTLLERSEADAIGARLKVKRDEAEQGIKAKVHALTKIARAITELKAKDILSSVDGTEIRVQITATQAEITATQKKIDDEQKKTTDILNEFFHRAQHCRCGYRKGFHDVQYLMKEAEYEGRAMKLKFNMCTGKDVSYMSLDGEEEIKIKHEEKPGEEKKDEENDEKDDDDEEKDDDDDETTTTTTPKRLKLDETTATTPEPAADASLPVPTFRPGTPLLPHVPSPSPLEPSEKNDEGVSSSV